MKPLTVHRDFYLDMRLPSFSAAERSGLVRFEPATGTVEISEPGIATLYGDFQSAELSRLREKFKGGL